MRLLPLFAGTLGVLAVLGPARIARACGGCFTQTESTQVTGHRMALAISPVQTTLWDQITYAGDPAEFGWVLPIRGQVEVDTSSDLLFELLESQTNVRIQSPPWPCPAQSCGGFFNSTAAFTAAASAGAGEPPVEVIAHEVVGPYETVQLASADPAALTAWLTSHGYAIPPDIEPVIASYVAEGFDFLAIRLVPGQGIQSMQPIRITSPGAGFSLPLRMVAAGTGATVPLALWVVGEARYAPQNMPSFEIRPNDLVWDFATQSSNYADLRKDGFEVSGYTAWLTAAALPVDASFFDRLLDEARYTPASSGYGSPDGTGALEKATADVDHLTRGIPLERLYVTALNTELSRSALGQDLDLAASLDGVVTPSLSVSASINQPVCPPPPDCSGDDGAGGSGVGAAGGGCTIEARDARGGAGVAATLLAVTVAAARRRRDRR